MKPTLNETLNECRTLLLGCITQQLPATVPVVNLHIVGNKLDALQVDLQGLVRERDLLLQVHQAARRVARWQGIDRPRHVLAVHDLADAIWRAQTPLAGATAEPPEPQHAPPAGQPASDAQLDELHEQLVGEVICSRDGLKLIARAVERLHRIEVAA